MRQTDDVSGYIFCIERKPSFLQKKNFLFPTHISYMEGKSPVQQAGFLHSSYQLHDCAVTINSMTSSNAPFWSRETKKHVKIPADRNRVFESGIRCNTKRL